MIKLIVERDRPPTFNLASDQEAARHARISVNAIAELAGRYHWLCTYATEEKLFSVIVVDDERTYNEWVQKTNAYTAGLKKQHELELIACDLMLISWLEISFARLFFRPDIS